MPKLTLKMTDIAKMDDKAFAAAFEKAGFPQVKLKKGEDTVRGPNDGKGWFYHHPSPRRRYTNVLGTVQVEANHTTGEVTFSQAGAK